MPIRDQQRVERSELEKKVQDEKEAIKRRYEALHSRFEAKLKNKGR